MSEFIMKRKDNYWWEVTLVKLGKPFIIFLTHTSVTPNMITLINLIIMLPLICLMAWEKSFFALALMVQIYMFLDIVDGNLARNKHMQSELGKKLDVISDTLFYTVGYFFIGLGVEAPIGVVLMAILVQHFYGMIATYYIVPKIRKLEVFKHTRLKKFFIERDILFGMDASLETLITSVLLLTSIRKYIYIVCPVLWMLDLIYRLYELNWVNRYNVKG